MEQPAVISEIFIVIYKTHVMAQAPALMKLNQKELTAVFQHLELIRAVIVLVSVKYQVQ